MSKYQTEEKKLYNVYSEYLKNKYGEKVYKLPVNLPIRCPNRMNGARGCSFCAECGTGFEAMSERVPVREQLQKTREYIESRYHAHKFIAYFQNYTNTFLPIDDFTSYLEEAANVPDIVAIDISTRPDCIREDYLDVLKDISGKYNIDITIELGLQTVNYHTLKQIERGHGIAEFVDAVLRIKKYHFPICAHVILNLPGDDMTDCTETARFLSALGIDIVKLHSLYIAKNTRLSETFEDGTISVCSKEEYIERAMVFLENLSPDMIVERIFSRVPEKDAIFSNWGTSWWKLQDELLDRMRESESYQGKRFDYLGGAALRKLQEA